MSWVLQFIQMLPGNVLRALSWPWTFFLQTVTNDREYPCSMCEAMEPEPEPERPNPANTFADDSTEDDVSFTDSDVTEDSTEDSTSSVESLELYFP